MFDYTAETEKSIEEAISSLEGSLKDEKFGVLWQFNVQEKLQEKGLEYNEAFHVLEVCNPNEAHRVLTQNKMAGYFLPCKIVVYEDKGKTKIGMPKPTSMIELINDESVQSFAAEIEERLIQCIKKSI